MQYVPILLFASVFVAQTVFDLGAIVFLLLHMSTIKRHLLSEAIVYSVYYTDTCEVTYLYIFW